VLENKWREDRLPDGSEKCMLDMLPRGTIVREAYAILSVLSACPAKFGENFKDLFSFFPLFFFLPLFFFFYFTSSIVASNAPDRQRDQEGSRRGASLALFQRARSSFLSMCT